MGKIKMTCRQAEKLIPLYLSGELDTKELKDFARHMEQCTVCTEELSVQYLVAEGMNRLESGEAFDLQKEVKENLEHLRTAACWKIRQQWITGILVLILVGMVVFIMGQML